MFEMKKLGRILKLHEKSYAMLRWAQDSLKRGSLSFGVAHDAMNLGSSAEEWIRRHLSSIPPSARPDPGDIPAFARLFASFILTSFNLKEDLTLLTSECGCRCSFCSRLRAGPKLVLRNPSRKAKATALELTGIYVKKLAVEMGIADADGKVRAVLANPDLQEHLAAAAWGNELLRRSEFASQGEGVLALWRGFAWKNGSPMRKFKLKADAICSAEKAVCEALMNASHVAGPPGCG